VSDVNEILVEFERLKSACRSMDGKKIVVGIVGDGVDSEVLKIAAAHEYGTDKLPERSFIRASFDADQDKLGSIVSGQVNKVLSGQISADAAANAIGAQAAQLVQNFIDENRVKPPSDFSKKTQHTTLYETGTHIRDRIAFKVEEE
jgi:hypothetical protein